MNSESSKDHPHSEENKWQRINTALNSNFFLSVDSGPVTQCEF